MATQRLKQFMSLLGISLATLLGGCGATPMRDDLVGIWMSGDGAVIVLEGDGAFTARGLPSRIFFRADQPNRPIDGRGTWVLQRGKPYWEVKLSFRERLGRPDSYGTSVIVSGSGASIYLYQWEGEEGDARYKFTRTSAASP